MQVRTSAGRLFSELPAHAAPYVLAHAEKPVPDYNSPMPEQITLAPIGTVHNSIREIVDDVFGAVISRIELDPARFTPDCLAGLEDFSHVEIVFALDRVPDAKLIFGASHPRGRADWPKVGVFAQRTKNRPNRIGVTVCRLISVRGLAIEVEGLDALDGTPVVDIKPHISEFGPRGPVRQPAWATELMSQYWSKQK